MLDKRRNWDVNCVFMDNHDVVETPTLFFNSIDSDLQLTPQEHPSSTPSPHGQLEPKSGYNWHDKNMSIFEPSKWSLSAPSLPRSHNNTSEAGRQLISLDGSNGVCMPADTPVSETCDENMMDRFQRQDVLTQSHVHSAKHPYSTENISDRASGRETLSDVDETGSSCSIELCPDCGCQHSMNSLRVASKSASEDECPATNVFDSPPASRRSITLENSALGETIRFMRYRAFLRWYKGAHERGWSRSATGILCLLAGALIIFSYYSMCSLYVIRHEVVIIYIGSLLVLSIVLALFSSVNFVPRYSVHISLVFIVVAICLVVVVNFRQGWNWEATSQTLTGAVPGAISIYDLPQFRESPEFKKKIEDVVEEIRRTSGCPIPRASVVNHSQQPSIALLTGSGISSPVHQFSDSSSPNQIPNQLSDNSCNMYKWFPIAFFIIQGALFVSGIFYSFVVNRIAQHYYLKSSWFISCWKIVQCYPVQLLVPALGQSDRKRYQELVNWGTLEESFHRRKRGILTPKRKQHLHLSSPTGRNRSSTFGQKLFQRHPVVGASHLMASTVEDVEVCATQSFQQSFPNNPGRHMATQVAFSSKPFATAPSLQKAQEMAVKPHSPFSRCTRGTDRPCRVGGNDWDGVTEGSVQPDTNRLRIVQGLRLEFSSYSEWRLRLGKLFDVLCCCLRCSRHARRDQVSLMSPEKVGCWRRRRKKKNTLNQDASHIEEYTPRLPKPQEMRASFIGEVGSDGRPEGFGYWRDEGYDFGERLVGYWKHGFPNGPHKSREIGTGSGFMCIRIGWARFTLTDNILKFGVANVECSVSGKFYRGYPHVKLLLPPEKIHVGQGLFSVAKDNFKNLKLSGPDATSNPRQRAGAKNRGGIQSEDMTKSPIGSTQGKEKDFSIPKAYLAGINDFSKNSAGSEEFSEALDRTVGNICQNAAKNTGTVYRENQSPTVINTTHETPPANQISKVSLASLTAPSLRAAKLCRPVGSHQQEMVQFNSDSIEAVLPGVSLSDIFETQQDEIYRFTPTATMFQSVSVVCHTASIIELTIEPPTGDSNSHTGMQLPSSEPLTASQRQITNSSPLPLPFSQESKENETGNRESPSSSSNMKGGHSSTVASDRQVITIQINKQLASPPISPESTKSPGPFARIFKRGQHGPSVAPSIPSNRHPPPLSTNDVSGVESSSQYMRRSWSVAVPERDISWFRRRPPSVEDTPDTVSEKKNPFKDFARNMPHQIKAGAAGAGAAVLRRLRKKDIEQIARLEKSRRDTAWCLAELSPHTPNFGIQPRSELTVSVDPQRGLYISGYVPRDHIEEEKLPAVQQALEELSRVGNIPALFVKTCLESAERKKVEQYPQTTPIVETSTQYNNSDEMHPLQNNSVERTPQKLDGGVEDEKSLMKSPLKRKTTSSRQGSGRKFKHAGFNEETTTPAISPMRAVASCKRDTQDTHSNFPPLPSTKNKPQLSGKADHHPNDNIPPSPRKPLGLFRLISRKDHWKSRPDTELVASTTFLSEAPIHRCSPSQFTSNTQVGDNIVVQQNHRAALDSPFRVFPSDTYSGARCLQPSPTVSNLPVTGTPNSKQQLCDKMDDSLQGAVGLKHSPEFEKNPVVLSNEKAVELEESLIAASDSLKRLWSLTPKGWFGGDEKKKNVVPVTVEESLAEMAVTGHTPFYRRPTIEKHVHKKDIKELKVCVVRRRLGAIPEKSVDPCERIAYHKPLEERISTQICTCACHHKKESPKHGDTLDLDLDIQTLPSFKRKAPILYQPDVNISKLDTWDGRVGLDTCELEPEGWMCIDAAGSPEVLLYIHGYNNSHIETLQILGQMAAFGNYPNHIRLFVFSWPAGSGFLEFFKARKAAEDTSTHQALADFLTSLRDNGTM